MRQFQSKRNTVFLHKGRVYKCFAQPGLATQEEQTLHALRAKGLPVPAVRHRLGRVLVMAYIDAAPLPDYMAAMGRALPCEALAAALVDWLEQFYAAVGHAQTGVIRGDVNGRNFLVAPGATRVWGVDFEELEQGRRERDAGRLLAFVERYDMEDRQLLETLSACLLQRFVGHMHLDEEAVLAERAAEFEAMKRRRV